MTVRTSAAPARTGPALRRAAGPARSRLAGLVLAVALVCLVGLVRDQLVGPVTISSGSMEPTLLAGDVVLVDKRPPDRSAVAHGDLVTFRSPDTGETVLKRVVALPGESVATIDAILHVDDRPVHEPYVDFSEWDGMFTARVVVPPDHVYVLGDNRLTSIDSRDFGPVPVDAVHGRVLVRLWPPVRLGGDAPQPPSD